MSKKTGTHAVTVRLDDEQAALLERQTLARGGQKAAILAGLRLLEGLDPVDVPAILEHAAREWRELQKLKRFTGKARRAPASAE